MRTDDQTDLAGTGLTGDLHVTPHPESASEPSHPAELSAAQARAVMLAQEHGDLDSAISFLTEACVPDTALVARLKKRKLHIRDEIVRIERACLPAASPPSAQRH